MPEAREGQSEPARPVVTWRAVLVALGLIPLNLYWVTQLEAIRFAGYPTTMSLFYTVVVTLLALVGLNNLMRRLRPAWALTAPELALVYIMLSLATAANGLDFGQVLVPSIAYPLHYATPENGWEQLFAPLLPKWLVVGGASAKGVWEGGESLFNPLMYRPWLAPMLWWTLFILALFMMELGANALFRKRWIEAERLTYPLIQLPLELIQPKVHLWRSRAFWWGLALASFIEGMNGLNALFPAVPALPVRLLGSENYSLSRFLTDPPWNAIGWTGISFYPFAIGLGLLLPLDLAFSCWFFLWFFKLERVGAAAIGVQGPGSPWVLEQSFGGFIGLALFALWNGRGYLAHTWRLARGKARGEDAAEYRKAFALLAVGSTFVFLFTVRAGTTGIYALAFFAIYLLLSLAVTRIRVELGLMAHDLHYSGPHQSLERILGSKRLGAANCAVGALYYWFNRAYRTHAMPHAAEGLKLVEATGGSSSRLMGAMLLAMLVGTLLSFGTQLDAYFKVGAAAGTWPPHSPLVKALEPWYELASKLSLPTQGSTASLLATLGGMAFTFGGMLARTRLTWWPLHPVGFAVSSSWAMERLWCPLFIAWLAKRLLVRYGGSKAYVRTVPFAFGLVLGDFLTGSFWNLLGVLFNLRAYS